jgi:hypothetical protein
MDTATFATTSLKVGELQEELICLLQQSDFPALLLKSAPGVGKTESVKWAARRCIHTDGAPYDLVILHPVGRDQSHVGGYPTIVNGEAVHVSYGDLRRLETASRPLVCLVDDFGQCAPSTQAAYQQLIQERSFNGVRVSPHVRFVLCTNRREDRAGVSGVITAITGRTVQIDVEPDVERLVQFLAEEYPDVQEIGSFLMKRPQFVTDPQYSEESRRGALVPYPSPRTIEYAAKIRRLRRPLSRELALIAGACGPAFANEFVGYCHLLRSLRPLSEILADPAGCSIPDFPHELYAECGSLAHAATPDNMPLLITYIGRFLFEYQEYFRQLIEVLRPDLCATTTFAEFVSALNDAR